MYMNVPANTWVYVFPTVWRFYSRTYTERTHVYLDSVYKNIHSGIFIMSSNWKHPKYPSTVNKVYEL